MLRPMGKEAKYLVPGRVKSAKRDPKSANTDSELVCPRIVR